MTILDNSYIWSDVSFGLFTARSEFWTDAIFFLLSHFVMNLILIFITFQIYWGTLFLHFNYDIFRSFGSILSVYLLTIDRHWKLFSQLRISFLHGYAGAILCFIDYCFCKGDHIIHVFCIMNLSPWSNRSLPEIITHFRNIYTFRGTSFDFSFQLSSNPTCAHSVKLTANQFPDILFLSLSQSLPVLSGSLFLWVQAYRNTNPSTVGLIGESGLERLYVFFVPFLASLRHFSCHFSRNFSRRPHTKSFIKIVFSHFSNYDSFTKEYPIRWDFWSAFLSP